jgi:hypothetical protein
MFRPIFYKHPLSSLLGIEVAIISIFKFILFNFNIATNLFPFPFFNSLLA